MKQPVILTFILALVLGLTLGAIFSPELRRAGDFFERNRKAPTSSSWKSAATPSGNNSVSTHATSATSGGEDLTLLLNEPNAFRQTDSLLTYVRSVPINGIPDALRQMEQHSGNGRDQALTLLTARWVDSDLEDAQNAIPDVQDGQLRYLLTHAVFSVLASHDPGDAIDQAQQLPTQSERNAAILAVVQQAAQEDPAQALTLFQNSKSAYGGAVNAIFAQWADKDVDEATEAALQLPQASDRNQAIESIVVRLVQKDTQAAMTWIDRLPPGEARNNAQENMVARIANNDPAAAADYVRGLQQVPADVENDLVQNIAMYWNETDPKACVAWAETLPPSQARNNALQFSLFAMVKNDPSTALSLINSLPLDAKDSTTMLSGVAGTWAQTDPVSALAWVGRMPAGATKDVSMRNVVGTWANSDPAKAAAYALTMPNGPVRDDVIGMIAASWASNDPPAAAQWISGLPESPLKANSYVTLAGAWAKNNPVEASNWLTQLPASTTRDGAIQSFIRQVVAGDPNGAYQWAESISNPGIRQEQVFEVLQRWQAFDPTGAAEAAQNSTLSPEQKNRFVLVAH